MRVGMLFGSFNPVHNGHVAIAQHALVAGNFDEVWLSVSPQNPWKQHSDLLPSTVRLHMVKLAINGLKGLKATNFEEELPRPSYTVWALAHLKNRFPDIDFALIIGSDNLAEFHKWFDYNEIIKNHELWVYPRVGYDANNDKLNYHTFNAPLFPVSSSEIRKLIKNNDDTQYLLHHDVYSYIVSENLYK
jgi:nicotinate-nucleotide adenylyltransferase